MSLSENSAAELIQNSLFKSAPVVISECEFQDSGNKKYDRLAEIIGGSKINIKSDIQKTVCYKNNVPFIFIDFDNLNLENLKYALNERNVEIKNIDLTNIDFRKHLYCFPIGAEHFRQIFSFACALYGYHLESLKPTKKETSKSQIKKEKKTYEEKIVFDFIEKFFIITESEKDYRYSKELHEKLNTYIETLAEKANIGSTTFTKITEKYSYKFNINFKIYSKEHHSTNKRAKALFGIKFDDKKFDEYLKQKEEEKSNDIIQTEEPEEEIENFIKEFSDYAKRIFVDINNNFKDKNKGCPVLFTPLNLNMESIF